MYSVSVLLYAFNDFNYHLEVYLAVTLKKQKGIKKERI